MKLISGVEIKHALNEIAPRLIAVAYVGADWKDYVDYSGLDEIVVSPTLGSNPTAILELATSIGWHRVHFLDNLHSKLYIGKTAAAIGSFNMTYNGLSAEGLEEAGVVVNDEIALAEVGQLFERYKEAAISRYPDEASKLRQIQTLRSLWRKAIRTGAIRNDSARRELADGPLALWDIPYVVCVWGELDYTANVEAPHKVRKSLGFLETDNVEPGRWMLCWECGGTGLPTGTDPYWMYIDDVVSEGSTHENYTKLAIEMDDGQGMSPPFELTNEINALILDLLRSKQFPQLLGTCDPWSLDDTIDVVPKFFSALQAKLKQPTAVAVLKSPAVVQNEAMSEIALREEFSARIFEAMDIALRRGLVTRSIAGILEKSHPVEVAKKFAKPGSKSRPGLRNLVKAGAPELTFEAIMMEPRFRPLFTASELQCAEFHLKHPDI